MKDEFRFLNGKQTLAFLKAGHFTSEQAMKAQANEKAWKRRPDVLAAFGEYAEWLDKQSEKETVSDESVSEVERQTDLGIFEGPDVHGGAGDGGKGKRGGAPKPAAGAGGV